MHPRQLGLWFLLLCICAASAHADDAIDEAFAKLRMSLDHIESQLPLIADAADAAAEMIIDGAGLRVEDRPLSHELSQNPGAMFTAKRRRNVTLALVGDRLVVTAQDQRFAIDSAGLPVVTAWAFKCELFAACVRRGEVPVVRQSFEIDTHRRRYWRYEGQRFHDDRWLDPTPAPESAEGGIDARPFNHGVLGQRYLAGLRAVLLDLDTAGRNAIERAIARAQTARDAGGTVYLVAGGPYLPHRLAPHLHAGLHAPEASHVNAKPVPMSDHTPGPDDFVIALGIDAHVGGEWWGDVDRLRAAGLGVAWVVNGCNTSPRDLHRRDILVDLWTPVGDGLVRVEHYDARLGPANTFAADAVYRAIVASLDRD